MRQAITRLLTNRWQGPLVLLATGLTAFAFLRLAPQPAPIDFDALYSRLLALQAQGEIAAASNGAANLLQHTPLTPAQRGKLHLFSAELLGDSLRKSPVRTAQNVQSLLAHVESAIASGAHLNPQQTRQYAQTLGVAGRAADAAVAYRRLIETASDAEMARSARTALARLLVENAVALGATSESAKLIEQLLDDVETPADERWWALQHALQTAMAAADWQCGQELLARHREALSTSDLQGYLQYLEGLLLVEQGRHAEALPIVEAVELWLHSGKMRADVLDSFGHLPAMSRLLRARIHLADEQPQAAFDAFVEAQALQPRNILIPALIGRGQALGSLEQHEQALAAFQQAAERIRAGGAHDSRFAQLRELLEASYAQTAERGHVPEALAYLRLASTLPCRKEMLLPLLERLGNAELAAATDAPPQQQRACHAAAGEAWAAAARLADAGSEHRATLLWTAAQEFDQAGRTQRVRDLLDELLGLGASDPRRPAALLQLGQSYESTGRYVQAIQSYDRLAQEYPRLEEAARGQFLKSGCLLAFGDEQVAQAERTLTALLESPSLSPQAAVFRDGLLSLSDLLYQQGRYADAIGRLENFLERYPGDAEEARAKFLLADAYRLSGIELARAAERGGTDLHRLNDSRDRFRDAVRHYRALREAHLQEPADEAGQVYRQLSLMGEADCLSELNEPETIATAVARYRQVGAENERTPAALIAQVQLARLHLRQDAVIEAARALERCRWLMQGISDEAFAAGADGLTRVDWERYFTTIAGAPLFQNAFSAD